MTGKLTIIDVDDAKLIVEKYKEIMAEIERDYGRNSITQKEWERKYPGLNYDMRAAGWTWECWALGQVLRHYDMSTE